MKFAKLPHGVDGPCAAFLETLPDNVKASPKRLWPHLKKHFVARTFYFGAKSKYYFEAFPGQYIPLLEKALIDELYEGGLLYAPKVPKAKQPPQPSKKGPKTLSATAIKRAEKDATNGKIREFLFTVRGTRLVDWVGNLSGHSPGLSSINHRPCLILHGPTLIEPREGNHLPVFSIVESLLAQDPEQLDYFLACLQRYRRLLLEGRYEPMQTLVFAGTHDDGKTLLATEIIGPALGDRRVDASAYLIGETRFNADLAESELWLMDDHNETKWYDVRILESILKKVSANPDIRAEPKGVNAMNARDLFRVVVCLFNIEGAGGSHLLPPLSEDFKGKVQIFHTQRADLPIGPNQFLEIRKLIRGAMPAFLYWLDKVFVPRAEILSGDRYQVKAYHNPEVCAQIDQHSAAMRLLPLLDNWLKESKTDKWEGSASELFTTFARDEGTFRTLTPICKSEDSLGRALTELFRRFPDRVEKIVNGHRVRYQILAEPSTKRPAEAENNATTMPPKDNVVANVKFR